MLDQSFSTENFRRILDYENRKGIYLEGRFFANLISITEQIKRHNLEIRIGKKMLSHEAFDDLRKKLNVKINELKEVKEQQLQEELQTISKIVVNDKFRISLNRNDTLLDKPVYIIEDKPENFFSLKQIQYNFRKLYKVKQSSRFSIVSQVKGLLADNFPKYIIRTDIEEFYENIPHNNLLKKLNEENLLTFYSKRLISQILNTYKQLSGTDKGVPRGIGVSAYLAELYMRDIDNHIKSLPNVTYYARYVDDIIIIFTPDTITEDKKYLDQIKDVVTTKHFLPLNSHKTIEIDHTVSSSSVTIEYLGYKIEFGSNPIKLKLTTKKINRYKKRIDLTLSSYLTHAIIDEKNARKILIKRLKFLTGNTRLLNNKRNILVGVFYSNSLLTDVSDLIGLDSYLAYKISSKITKPQLITRLSRYKFKDGFSEKRFSPFTTNELSQIIEIWK